MQEWTPFIGEKLHCQRNEANEQNPYAVTVVKRTAGCGIRTGMAGMALAGPIFEN